MAYTTFEYYNGRGGQLSATDFVLYSEKASDYLDYITMDKSKTYTDTDDRLKKCCCALIDEIYKQRNRAGISSEHIGSYSVTYTTDADKKELASICRIYIGTTGLMYRGL